MGECHNVTSVKASVNFVEVSEPTAAVVTKES